MDTAADRLRRARREAGFSTAAQAIERFSWNKNTYSSNENGNASFGRKKADEYAKAFSVRGDWLYSGEGSMRLNGAPKMVPLIGYVGAGAEAHFYANTDEGLGEVEAPEGATSSTKAAEIRGESLGPLFEHWLIFYDDVRTPVTPDLIGKLCIVGLPNDKVLVKKIRRSRTEGLFHLLSNNEEPMLDQEVHWAALVKHMTPR